ncbi:MAG: hypothetical protein ABDH21_05010 [bacterium]
MTRKIVTIVLVILVLVSKSLGSVYLIPSPSDIEAYFVDNRSSYTGLIVSSIHGNEKLPSVVVKKLLYSLPNDLNYCLIVEPSRYRIKANRRETFEGLDPNRTFLNLFSISSEFIVHQIVKYRPLFIIDIHQANKSDVDFMYAFGNFARIMFHIYQIDGSRFSDFKVLKSLYTPEFSRMIELQREIENLSIENFVASGYRVDRYVVSGRTDPYEAVSILRNLGAAYGIFSVLFELPFENPNSEKAIYKILPSYLKLLSSNAQKLQEYQYLSKNIQWQYFSSRFFIIPYEYSKSKNLVEFLNIFGIQTFEVGKSWLNMDGGVYKLIIKDLRAKNKREFRNFVYFTLDVTFEKIKENDHLYTSDKYYIVQSDILSSFLLNPVYEESVWNFFVLPFSNKFLPVYIKVHNYNE